MTRHRISDDDRAFLGSFETCTIAPSTFHHREHVRLAYLYLCNGGVRDAHRRLRASLLAFLAHNGVDAATYHETITRAWILAVDHFMEPAEPAASFDAFIAANPRLLDTNIMLTHYTKARLFSDDARAAFIEPDLDPIPRRG
ncbi:MAG: hypothetical protein M3Q55_04250 [Acidobacteriota bacterium]|nr:hypothetical protein [Acidobacteriota bacterium]